VKNGQNHLQERGGFRKKETNHRDCGGQHFQAPSSLTLKRKRGGESIEKVKHGEVAKRALVNIPSRHGISFVGQKTKQKEKGGRHAVKMKDGKRKSEEK